MSRSCGVSSGGNFVIWLVRLSIVKKVRLVDQLNWAVVDSLVDEIRSMVR